MIKSGASQPMPALRLGGYWASGLSFTNIKGAHRSPDLVCATRPLSRGLLHYLFNTENSKCSVYSFTELWANASTDNNRYHLGLIRHQANMLQRLLKTLAQGLVRRLLSPLMCVSDFRMTHILRATGYISRHRIHCTNQN